MCACIICALCTFFILSANMHVLLSLFDDNMSIFKPWEGLALIRNISYIIFLLNIEMINWCFFIYIKPSLMLLRFNTVGASRKLTFSLLTAKLFNLNFHPPEVVSRWCDPQLQVSENYSYLTKWRSTLFKSCWSMTHFIFTIFNMWYLMC